MEGHVMLTQSAIQPRSLKPALNANPGVAAAARDVIDLMGASMTFKRNAEIYGENEDAEYLYRVVTGTVRTYKVLADGRRQIGAFYVPGDVFGLENGAEHVFSAEAVADSKVLVVKR